MTAPAAFPPLWLRPGLADARDDEHVRHDALGVAHHAVAVRQVLDQVVAHAERRLLPADRCVTLQQCAVELVVADPLVQHQQMIGVDDVFVVLQPVAALDHPDCVVAPQPHPAQYDILAPLLTIPGQIDDVEAREEWLGAGRTHIDENEPTIFRRRIGGLPYLHCLTELLGFARHVDAPALRVVEPAVIAAADAALLDAAPFERGSAMRAMRVDGADPPLLVPEHDDVLAQELFLARKVAQLVGRADRLPIAAQEFAHRAARLDAGQLVIGCGGLPSVGRYHCVPPLSPAPRFRDAGAGACEPNRWVRYFQFHVVPSASRGRSSLTGRRDQPLRRVRPAWRHPRAYAIYGTGGPGKPQSCGPVTVISKQLRRSRLPRYEVPPAHGERGRVDQN